MEITVVGAGYVGLSLAVLISQKSKVNLIDNQKLIDEREESIPIPIIFSSSCATYGVPHKLPIFENCHQNPINPYGRTKLIIEMLLKTIYSDEKTHHFENNLVRRVAGLVYVEDVHVGELKNKLKLMFIL